MMQICDISARLRAKTGRWIGASFLGLLCWVALPVWADEYAAVSKMLRAGQLNEAATKADQFLVAKPKDPQMRFLKGVILSERGKTADAIGIFAKLTEDYPELPEPYNNLAVLYASQGQFDKARSTLESAIRTNPSYSVAHENLGDVYAKLASQAYSKALQLDSAGAATATPKLAIIKEIFTPNTRATRTATAAVPAATTPNPAPAAPATPIAQPVAKAPSPTPAATPSATPASALASLPVTKPAAVPAPTQLPPATASADGTDQKTKVEDAIRAWATAWSSKDVKRYLSYYAPSFDPVGKQSRAEWENDRRARIEGKSRISVKLSAIQITVNGKTAVAKFRQDYQADALSVSSRKSLDLVRNGERWQIVKENSN